MEVKFKQLFTQPITTEIRIQNHSCLNPEFNFFHYNIPQLCLEKVVSPQISLGISAYYNILLETWNAISIQKALVRSSAIKKWV